MSQNNWPFIINVGNSIIGVTVLAMPFCFQACGIVLGTLLLLFATWLTIVSCQLLMKAGVTARRRSYSLLAMFTHGAFGKLIVEVGMIGLQLGTLIAQVVIIGDLGPAIVSKATGLQNSDNLRTGLIVVLCLFIGLPLGLLKDVRTLSKTSSICMAFYAFFSAYVVVLSVPNLVAGDWYNKVNFWRMEGFFQCLPIFSFAFGCQTQLFIVYDALSEPSLKRINSIVGSAVNVCSVSYLLVGFFGYVAFCNSGELSGDIINHFKKDNMCDVIKILFVFSIAVTIPLIVFPCRASLYTLCFPHKPRDDVPGGGKIPETHFKVITVIIIVGAMITGILIPNIEFVLGINGATMGTLICYIFPALFFLSVMSDKAEGLIAGKIVLALGLIIMVASTYTILSTESTEVRVDALDTGESNPVIDVAKIEQSKRLIENLKGETASPNKSKMEENHVNTQERREPPVPQAPIYDDVNQKKEIDGQIVKRSDDNLKDQIDKTKLAEGQQIDKIQENVDKIGEKDKDKHVVQENKVAQDKVKEQDKLKETEKKQNEILEKLEQQQEQQEKLIQEQKEILDQLKEHKDSHKADESALKQNEKQEPAKMDQKQLPIIDQVLRLNENGNQGEQKKLLDNEVLQKEDLQIPKKNQQGDVQIQHVNLLDDNRGPEEKQIMGAQTASNNQQADAQIPQHNLQKLNDGRLPMQEDTQVEKKLDENLQFQKLQIPADQQVVKQDAVLMQPGTGLQTSQTGNVNQPVNNPNNIQQQHGDVRLNVEANARNKRDVDSIAFKQDNVLRTGVTVEIEDKALSNKTHDTYVNKPAEQNVKDIDKASKDSNNNTNIKNDNIQGELKEMKIDPSKTR